MDFNFNLERLAGEKTQYQSVRKCAQRLGINMDARTDYKFPEREGLNFERPPDEKKTLCPKK